MRHHERWDQQEIHQAKPTAFHRIPCSGTLWCSAPIFGSPDVRQIDGLGGADPLTSKLAVIGPPSRPDADVDYTFGQVSINAANVDYSGNCGNISSAVGPYAIEEGFVKCSEPFTTVRIHNTNANKILVAEVPVACGSPKVAGGCKISGVPGAGARLVLNFAGTAGSVTGKLLPTGNVIDTIETGQGPIQASIVDCANPMVFVRASEWALRALKAPWKSMEIRSFFAVWRRSGRWWRSEDRNGARRGNRNRQKPRIPHDRHGVAPS